MVHTTLVSPKNEASDVCGIKVENSKELKEQIVKNITFSIIIFHQVNFKSEFVMFIQVPCGCIHT